MVRNYSILALLLVMVMSFSCNRKNEDNPVSIEETIIRSYFDSTNLADVQADTAGIYAWPIRLNPDGKDQSQGNVLSFFYSLNVLNGEIIDVMDSLDSDTTIVKQGVNAIYPIGIDYALRYLKVGEKWAFVIPSYLAYETYSFSTLLPANATIYLEIELLEIRTEDDVLNEELDAISDYIIEANLSDTLKVPINKPETLVNGMVYKRLSQGAGDRPQNGQLVALTYEGRFLDSLVFDRAPNADFFEFYYGLDGVIPGFELGVGKMQIGEKALLILPSYLAYRESAQVIPNFLTDDMAELNIVPTYASKVGPYKPLIFEISLIDIN